MNEPNDPDSEPPTKPGGGRRRPILMIETESMPPDARPPEKWERGPESLLPPRALPGAGISASFVAGASAAAYSVENATVRALLMLACGVTVWLVGYVTPPPRRRFRREDRR